MYLYNSLSHKKEKFIPNHPDIVKMYTCGPTVYHYAHIGNLRSYIMEDVLEKYLRYTGYAVKRVMNITDVGHLASDADTGEDKMLKGAKREHKSVMEIAQFYTDAFFDDCRKLNIKRPDVVEPATNCIASYIAMISPYWSEDTLTWPVAMCTSTHRSWKNTMSSTITRKRTWRLESGKAWRKTGINETRTTLSSGLRNLNLRTRR